MWTPQIPSHFLMALPVGPTNAQFLFMNQDKYLKKGHGRGTLVMVKNLKKKAGDDWSKLSDYRRGIFAGARAAAINTTRENRRPQGADDKRLAAAQRVALDLWRLGATQPPRGVPVGAVSAGVVLHGGRRASRRYDDAGPVRRGARPRRAARGRATPSSARVRPRGGVKAQGAVADRRPGAAAALARPGGASGSRTWGRGGGAGGRGVDAYGEPRPSARLRQNAARARSCARCAPPRRHGGARSRVSSCSQPTAAPARRRGRWSRSRPSRCASCLPCSLGPAPVTMRPLAAAACRP